MARGSHRMFAELTRLVANITLTSVFAVERATRIELALSAWEADVLPLNYARAGHQAKLRHPTKSGSLMWTRVPRSSDKPARPRTKGLPEGRAGEGGELLARTHTSPAYRPWEPSHSGGPGNGGVNVAKPTGQTPYPWVRSRQ
jgi:hypothetical protein